MRSRVGALLLWLAVVVNTQPARELAGQTPESIKLSRTFEGYALSWVAKNSLSGIQVVHFASLPQALSYIQRHFPELRSTPSLGWQSSLPARGSVLKEWERYVLRWQVEDEEPRQLSFASEYEARFFLEHFAHGRYARSPVGHAIPFTR